MKVRFKKDDTYISIECESVADALTLIRELRGQVESVAQDPPAALPTQPPVLPADPGVATPKSPLVVRGKLTRWSRIHAIETWLLDHGPGDRRQIMEAFPDTFPSISACSQFLMQATNNASSKIVRIGPGLYHHADREGDTTPRASEDFREDSEGEHAPGEVSGSQEVGAC